MSDGSAAGGERPRLYVGVYALCVRDGKILLARLGPSMREAGQWTLPGGGLDWGEAPEVGVRRELAEETGLSGDVGPVVGLFSATYPRTPERDDEPVHHLGIVFRVDVHPGAEQHEADGSTDRCAWFRLDELVDLPLVPLAAYARDRLLPTTEGRSRG